ncbi:transcription antitermination factor NusB [Sporolituus thermophilus]|uniref:Transcription antitermination protein NusB n=1 Tax=Sporolituus thermophilus DSM 23256 TaxID=1123285 RepID=A0A1G7IB98_9FIRM|nr:transcription antitermination factor NusB [Sporolituus thermophilus]SDF09935.1 NusB antitermination factor [Sporolituus thermophilus DSM 23256]
MSRRKAREIALQTLFQLDFNDTDPVAALAALAQDRDDVSKTAQEYARQLVTGTKDHLTEIDAIIAGQAREWKLERMAGVDRNIVRMAIYEMRYGPEKLPPNVVINEAVELAKTFGTEESGRFVNGILGALVKQQAAQDA